MAEKHNGVGKARDLRHIVEYVQNVVPIRRDMLLAVIDGFAESVASRLSSGQPIVVPHLGTFSPDALSARKGEPRVVFTPNKKLAKLLTSCARYPKRTAP